MSQKARREQHREEWRNNRSSRKWWDTVACNLPISVLLRVSSKLLSFTDRAQDGNPVFLSLSKVLLYTLCFPCFSQWLAEWCARLQPCSDGRAIGQCLPSSEAELHPRPLLSGLKECLFRCHHGQKSMQCFLCWSLIYSLELSFGKLRSWMQMVPKTYQALSTMVLKSHFRRNNNWTITRTTRYCCNNVKLLQTQLTG